MSISKIDKSDLYKEQLELRKIEETREAYEYAQKERSRWNEEQVAEEHTIFLLLQEIEDSEDIEVEEQSYINDIKDCMRYNKNKREEMLEEMQEVHRKKIIEGDIKEEKIRKNIQEKS